MNIHSNHSNHSNAKEEHTCHVLRYSVAVSDVHEGYLVYTDHDMFRPPDSNDCNWAFFGPMVLHFWVPNWNCSEEKVMTMLFDVQMKLVEDGKTSELAFANYSAWRFQRCAFFLVHSYSVIFDPFSMLIFK